MRTSILAGFILLLGSGCAISRVERINQRLKEDNTQLISQNRDLRLSEQAARDEAMRHRLDLERARQKIAQLELQGSKPVHTDGPTPEESTDNFKDITDVDVQVDPEGTRVILSEKVFFRPGSCAINDRGKGALQKVAGVLKAQYPTSRIRIEGHTDNTQIRAKKDIYASNWELSTARACAVLRTLQGAGINPERMFAAGYAYFRSVASNSTEAGKQKNRRVEIVILKN